MKANVGAVLLLLLGIVDQISDGTAVVEYEERPGIITHSEVDLSLSACTPREGQHVYFFRDYKIVTCLTNS